MFGLGPSELVLIGICVVVFLAVLGTVGIVFLVTARRRGPRD
jgi:hypothetical protein